MMMSEDGIIDKTYITKYHINLEVIKKKYYNKEKLTRTEKVLLMLKMKERETLKEISKGDDLMKNMYEELCKMSEDKNIILYYSKEELELEAEKIEAREKGLREGIDQGIEQGIKEGREKGIKEGIKEGEIKGKMEGKMEEKINIARNLLKMDMDLENIIKATGLSKEEIMNIK